MVSSPVEQSVGSAAYGFIGYLGCGLSPFAVGNSATVQPAHALPHRCGCCSCRSHQVVAHQMLAHADQGLDDDGHRAELGGAGAPSTASWKRGTTQASAVWAGGTHLVWGGQARLVGFLPGP
jgi:hypothetical protein